MLIFRIKTYMSLHFNLGYFSAPRLPFTGNSDLVVYYRSLIIRRQGDRGRATNVVAQHFPILPFSVTAKGPDHVQNHTPLSVCLDLFDLKPMNEISLTYSNRKITVVNVVIYELANRIIHHRKERKQ